MKPFLRPEPDAIPDRAGEARELIPRICALAQGAKIAATRIAAGNKEANFRVPLHLISVLQVSLLVIAG